MSTQFDERTEANLATLTPNTQAMARRFLSDIAAKEALPPCFVVKIISGTRTYAEQNALYAQGRTAPGPKVTNAPGGYSNHNFGIAFDLGIFDPQGRYIDDLPGVDPNWTERVVSAHYRTLAAIGEGLGLTWGGDWVSIDDEPHYELHPWPRLSEDEMLAKLRAMHADGGAVA